MATLTSEVVGALAASLTSSRRVGMLDSDRSARKHMEITGEKERRSLPAAIIPHIQVENGRFAARE